MWDNEDWANNHIKKHSTSTQEAWIGHRETINLITAFEPDQQRIDLYENLKKKTKNR